MHYFLEALIVGIYTVIIYILYSLLSIKNFYLLLFLVGFNKHLLGYFFNLHTYYCKYGYACNNKDSNVTTELTIFLESIGEGLIFIFFGSTLTAFSYLRKNTILTFFVLGFILHISFEILGIHSRFCDERCE
jgi:hypothetical protein